MGSLEILLLIVTDIIDLLLVTSAVILSHAFTKYKLSGVFTCSSRSVIIGSVTFDAVNYHNNDSLVTTVHNPFSRVTATESEVRDVSYGRPME